MEELDDIVDAAPLFGGGGVGGAGPSAGGADAEAGKVQAKPSAPPTPPPPQPEAGPPKRRKLVAGESVTKWCVCCRDWSPDVSGTKRLC
eukprot:821941-Alexandrium_andersonii.AAC.1